MTIFLFAIIGIGIPTVIALRHFYGLDPLAWLQPMSGRQWVGLLFTLLAVTVCLLNFYLTILAPWLYQKRHGSMEGFGLISGLPLIGGIFVLVAGSLMPASLYLGIFFLMLYAMDGNGLPWLFFSTLRRGM